MYITNHYLVAIHNDSCSVLVRLCVFTCCEPPRCLQVRCRLTCSNRSPNHFISSRSAVDGARSFVPTISSPEKKTENTYALSSRAAIAEGEWWLSRARREYRYTWTVETRSAPNIRNVLLLLLLWLFVMWRRRRCRRIIANRVIRGNCIGILYADTTRSRHKFMVHVTSLRTRGLSFRLLPRSVRVLVVSIIFARTSAIRSRRRDFKRYHIIYYNMWYCKIVYHY
jgi:hypothetical protein